MKDRMTANGYCTELYEVDGERHKRIALVYGRNQEMAHARRRLFRAALQLARVKGDEALDDIRTELEHVTAGEAEDPDYPLCYPPEVEEQGAILGWFLGGLLVALGLIWWWMS